MPEVAALGPPVHGDVRTHTCTGGRWNPADPPSSTFVDIPSGTYASITVKGVCDIPADALVNVVGNVNVGAGAVLDAQSTPSTITVGHNVTASGVNG